MVAIIYIYTYIHCLFSPAASVPPDATASVTGTEGFINSAGRRNSTGAAARENNNVGKKMWFFCLYFPSLFSILMFHQMFQGSALIFCSTSRFRHWVPPASMFNSVFRLDALTLFSVFMFCIYVQSPVTRLISYGCYSLRTSCFLYSKIKVLCVYSSMSLL